MKRVNSGHDQGNKRLFSHPQAVEELLRGFLRADWVEKLDLSTLERMNSSFVSEPLNERRTDVIWRVRWRGDGAGWFYLYILLELQSTSYPFMAVRLLTYVGLLLEEIIHKEKLKARDRLPAVLPLVFYNGKGSWRAPLDLASLFEEMPESLRRYLPQLRYVVLDENRLDLNRPELAGNRVASLFRIETCEDPEDVFRLTRELAALLPDGKDPELRRTIQLWVIRVLRHLFPGVKISGKINWEDISVIDNMHTWREKTKREARREGRTEGIRDVLLRQMERRFGPIPENVRQRLEEITSTRQLNRLADRLLTAGSLREMGL